MQPPLVVVMGISGVGKSAIGHEIADRFDLPYVDGDDFHPPANIAKMSAGTPLTDDDRWPWLEDIARWLHEHEETGGVISCSALKRSYRDVLRGRGPGDDQAQGSTRIGFVHLAGDHDLIKSRMEGRDHFMPSSLLISQEETLEPLGEDENGWVLDIVHSPAEIVDSLIERGALPEPQGERA